MKARIYISPKEAINRISFFGHFDRGNEPTQYTFVKNFTSDIEHYEVFYKNTGDKAGVYTEKDIVRSDIMFYILKESNINNY